MLGFELRTRYLGCLGSSLYQPLVMRLSLTRMGFGALRGEIRFEVIDYRANCLRAGVKELYKACWFSLELGL